MNYLIKDEEKGNLLIYECNPIPNKIYEYRKNEIENQTHPIATAKVSYKYGNIKDEKIIEKQYLKFHYIGLMDADKKQILLQEKNFLLESYYNSEIFKNEYSYRSKQVMVYPNDNKHYYNNFEHMLLPNKLTISSYDKYEDCGYTNDIIHINEKLLFLEKIRTGTMQFMYLNIDDILDQLQCFDFSVVDEIKLSALNKLLSDKNICANSPYCASHDSLVYINDRIEVGQKILSLTKNKNSN